MSRTWNIGELPADERAEAVHEVIARMTGTVSIKFSQKGRSVEANGTTAHLGPLTLATVRSNAQSVERTNSHIKDDFEPSVYLGLQIQGSSTVIQCGRQVTLRPGDLIVYDSTEPYTLLDAAGIWQHFFKIPLDRLALNPDVLRRVSATRLAPGHPVSGLTSKHFERLAAGPENFEGLAVGAIGQPSIDLLRVVITAHAGEENAHRKVLNEALPTRIMEFVRDNLADPELNAARVAAEHHISVRYLYKILAAEEVPLAEWIRTRRLEECRAELKRTVSAPDTIEAVARRWGFTDMSSFSRAFRSVYGLTPRDWRNLHRDSRI
ncbi:helix-turn-helix domain-containing protein [Streptomyces sp. SAS_275]|uniref:helix-turn-helix domain-containing protein n=1 Tax=Streptomyces sp. SAS_275 TaxID=3412746 RepID=UPI00403C829C